MNYNYLVMKNGHAIIGLFQGMFEKNILTFNPGWDENAKVLESFTDIRDLQKELKGKGIKFETEIDDRASFMLLDPDGNHILIDQHV